MNSDAIFALIENIAATSKKTEKVALVAANKDDADFIRVLQAALDLRITYNMQKVPDREADAAGTAVFDDSVWSLLGQLADRRLSGNLAAGVVEDAMGRFSPSSAELFKRIIKKDLRAGFGASTVNKAIDGLIFEQPYMRCSLPPKAKFESWPWAEGVFSELKADGMFANFDVGLDRTVRITSRQGEDFPLAGALEELVAAVAGNLRPGTQSHGEMLVERDGVTLPREQSNGAMNSVAKGGELGPGERVVAVLWDQIPLHEAKPNGQVNTPYRDRYAALTAQLPGDGVGPLSTIETRVVYSIAEAYAHYREILVKGGEGTVAKKPGAIWRDGDSLEQVKLKLAADCDLVIVDFRPGEGKNAALFGSVVCRTADGLLEVAVSGMTDKVRKEVAANRDSYLGTIMTVRSNSIMAPPSAGQLHSLFSPRVVEFRRDKTQADTLARVREQFDAAICAA